MTVLTYYWHAVKVIFLDTRWFRQSHCIPSVAGKVPLGAGLACATRWLSAGLLPHYCSGQEPPARPARGRPVGVAGGATAATPNRHRHRSNNHHPRCLCVVSSIQVLTTNPVMESWGHFPAERERLLRLLLRVSSKSEQFCRATCTTAKFWIPFQQWQPP